MTSLELAGKLNQAFQGKLSDPVEFRGEVTLFLHDAQLIKDICAFAKADLGFNYLVDLSSVDEGDQSPRFTLVYELYGYTHRCHLRIKTAVSEEDPILPTVCDVWRTANWHEREVYDMMGIGFKGHPDLRRILMWEGYPYFPLRKDFPLSGKPTALPEVAFTRSAPLEGGPFVTIPGGTDTQAREPRVRIPESD